MLTLIFIYFAADTSPAVFANRYTVVSATTAVRVITMSVPVICTRAASAAVVPAASVVTE